MPDKVAKNKANDTTVSSYFAGTRIYGDDFTVDEIREWYRDEEEAYTDLYVRGKKYEYDTHALNVYHLFSHIPKRDYHHVLGFGAAGGDEFLPLLDHIKSIIIIEPSSLYEGRNSVGDVPCKWIKPNISGKLPFDNNSFDLITCISALHHVPNVSFVLSELYRVLKPDGFMLLREPVISMGDWRKPRPGLTKRERGIPLPWLRGNLQKIGFDILAQSRCKFPLVDIIFSKLNLSPYNYPAIVRLDAILSSLFAWNYRYHRTKWWHKVSPRSACFVLKKHG